MPVCDQQDVPSGEDHYRELYRIAPVGFLTLDSQGRIIEANPAAARLLAGKGRPGKKSRLSAFLTQESVAEFRSCLRKAVAGGGAESCEVRFKTDGEEERWLILSCTAVLTKGETRLLLATLTDISERRKLEEALLSAHELMDRKVALGTAELREKERLLVNQSRHAAMGEMISNIAHQWRQPLNSLGLIIQSLPLMYELGEMDQEFLNSSATRGMEIINHMSQTIDAFRNYFRPDKEMSVFQLKTAVEKTVSLIKESFASMHIDLQVNMTDEPQVRGYPNEYAQVLLNVLLNARDAFVGKKVEKPTITVNIGEENGRGIVTVRDNAGGIPEEIIDRVFDPYFTTKGPDGGTGVGLFMSKSIIEKNMGGILTARNTGDGAEFRIEV